ncbi:MAG: hypothetical protein Q4Q62_06460 [Thermoplasmata archaeon]|nr:hypothetical protein [Thermoplasmata archaeon]
MPDDVASKDLPRILIIVVDDPSVTRQLAEATPEEFDDVALNFIKRYRAVDSNGSPLFYDHAWILDCEKFNLYINSLSQSGS